MSNEWRNLGQALKERGRKPKVDIGDVWTRQNSNKKPLASSTRRSMAEKFKEKTGRRLGTIKKSADRVNSSRINSKVNLKTGVIVAVVTLSVLGFFLKPSNKKANIIDETAPITLGTNIDGTKIPSVILPKTDSTEFELLFSAGKTKADFELVVVSPPGNDTVYAYIDRVGGVDVSVSVQELPKGFEDDLNLSTKELAESFQATSTIKIDDTVVYHGYSDKNGGKQSLIFVKNKLLIFIASPEKLLDDVWAGYISSLQ